MSDSMADPSKTENGYFSELIDLKLTDAEFDAMEAKMLEAKQNPPKSKRPAKTDRSPAELDGIETMLRIMYESEQWNAVIEFHLDLMNEGFDGWLNFIRPRLALALAIHRREFYSHAKFGWDTYPGEPDSYAAMAVAKCDLGQFEQSAKWLRIALKASSGERYVLTTLQQKLDWANATCTRHVFVLCPSQASISDDVWSMAQKTLDAFSEDTKVLVEKIRKDPSSLRSIRESSHELTLLWPILWGSRGFIFQVLPTDDQKAAARPSGGAFAQISEELFVKMSRFISAEDLSTLELTCPHLRNLVNQNQVWKNAFEAVHDSVCPEEDAVFSWRHNLHVLNYLDEALERLSNLTDEAITTNSFPFNQAPLRDLLLKSEAFGFGCYDCPVLPVLLSINKFILMDDTTNMATHFSQYLPTLVLLLLPLPSPDTQSFLTALLQTFTFMVLRAGAGALCASMGMLPLLHSFLSSPLQVDAGALIAAIFSSQYLDPKQIVPARMVQGHVTPEEDLAATCKSELNGIYHCFMVYEDFEMHGCVEKAVYKVEFEPHANKIKGIGVDTIGGKLKLTDAEAGPYLGFEVTYDTKDKKKPSKLCFQGSITPLGFGGLFGLETREPVREGGPNHLGYWFMCRQASSMGNGSWSMLSTKIIQEGASNRGRYEVKQPWIPGYERSAEATYVSALSYVKAFYNLLLSPAGDFGCMMAAVRALPELESPELEAAMRSSNVPPLPITRGPAETEEYYQIRKTYLAKILAVTFPLILSIVDGRSSEIENSVKILRDRTHASSADLRLQWLFLLSASCFDSYVDQDYMAQSLADLAEVVVAMKREAALQGQQQQQYGGGGGGRNIGVVDGNSDEDAESDEAYDDDEEDDDDEDEVDPDEDSFQRAVRKHERKLERRKQRAARVGKYSKKKKVGSGSSSSPSISTTAFLLITGAAVATLAVGAFVVGRLVGQSKKN